LQDCCCVAPCRARMPMRADGPSATLGVAPRSRADTLSLLKGGGLRQARPTRSLQQELCKKALHKRVRQRWVNLARPQAASLGARRDRSALQCSRIGSHRRSYGSQTGAIIHSRELPSPSSLRASAIHRLRERVSPQAFDIRRRGEYTLLSPEPVGRKEVVTMTKTTRIPSEVGHRSPPMPEGDRIG
jgi:hypothetical protein